MYELTVETTFEAAHSILGHTICGEIHGHTYRVEVSYRSEETIPPFGFVVDFGKLKTTLRNVCAAFDHSNLNDYFEFPTAEALAEYIYNMMKLKFPYVSSVTIWEGMNNRIRYFED